MKKFSIVLATSLLLISCGNTGKAPRGGLNLFSISQDKELGAQVDGEIMANSAQYPILDPAQNKEIYNYINDIRNTILSSGNVKYKTEFDWQIRIIHDDNTLNAFCTPGGYIYIYTGILKFLDTEDQFAGVLAHEIAHADLRHSTRQMTQMYGVEMLLGVLAGDRELVRQVSAGLIGLKFSRNHETEADYNSVHYLCPTSYNASGGGGFFEKINGLGGSQTPEFLSTHPNPDNRIEAFNNNKITMGCQGAETNANRYKQMIAKLP